MIFMVKRGNSRFRLWLLTPCDVMIGFDMSAMKEEVYGEAIIDIAKAETLVSDPVMIKVRQPALLSFRHLTNPTRVGHIHPRRAIASTQLPITFPPCVHLNETH